MRQFWPAKEPSQLDYERVRSVVLSTGRLPDDLASARLGRRGLAGLIVWPEAEPVFSAELIGATRPAWTPHADARVEALAGAYLLLLREPPDPAVTVADRGRA